MEETHSTLLSSKLRNWCLPSTYKATSFFLTYLIS